MEFKCTCNHENEDNTLELIVEDGIRHVFKINPDGSLKHVDSDGMGQIVYLQCPLCGKEYEFVNEYVGLEEEFVLKSYDYSAYPYQTNKISRKDLEFVSKNKEDY